MGTALCRFLWPVGLSGCAFRRLFTSPKSLPPTDIADPLHGPRQGTHKLEVECSRTAASASAIMWGGSAARPGERVDLKRDKRGTGKGALGDDGWS